jgi:hypothetical protein
MLNTIHITRDGDRTPINQLKNEHLLNIIRYHSKRASTALQKTCEENVYDVFYYQERVAPYVFEALARRIYKEVEHEIENVYFRHDAVAPGVKARFDEAHRKEVEELRENREWSDHVDEFNGFEERYEIDYHTHSLTHP